MTRGQARAFNELTARYSATSADIVQHVGDRALGVEIGFGMGQALHAWACDVAAEDWQLFGVELYQPGVAALSDALARDDLNNVGIVQTPAQIVFAELPDRCLQEVRIFFPDPWPKKRHHKRRLIQPAFVAELARVICLGGRIRLATDWTPYAQWMRECFATNVDLQASVDQIRAADEPQSDKPTDVARAPTKFEQRGERLGHQIHDLVFERVVR